MKMTKPSGVTARMLRRKLTRKTRIATVTKAKASMNVLERTHVLLSTLLHPQTLLRRMASKAMEEMMSHQKSRLCGKSSGSLPWWVKKVKV
mmetsp:Transcript_14602/g.39097  ORF Transcript_14602/g.39097 Transcript_14602/m.39097 type:complete len:91 (+) Transcript_14602:226-498(+)